MRTLLIVMLLVLNGCATQKVDTAFCESERDKIVDSTPPNAPMKDAVNDMMRAQRVYKSCMALK